MRETKNLDRAAEIISEKFDVLNIEGTYLQVKSRNVGIIPYPHHLEELLADNNIPARVKKVSSHVCYVYVYEVKFLDGDNFHDVSDNIMAAIKSAVENENKADALTHICQLEQLVRYTLN